MTGWISDEVRLLARPFATYRELATTQDDAPARTVLSRTFSLLLVLGGSVSLITSGRLTARLILGTSLAWAMVPVIEAIVVVVMTVLGRPRFGFVRAIGLYMAGNAPLLIFMLAVAGTCLFAPDVAAAFRLGLRTLVLPGLLVVALFESWLLSYAYYRAAAGFGRAKSAILVAVDVGLKTACVVGWFLSINNIFPQFMGTAR